MARPHGIGGVQPRGAPCACGSHRGCGAWVRAVLLQPLQEQWISPGPGAAALRARGRESLPHGGVPPGVSLLTTVWGESGLCDVHRAKRPPCQPLPLLLLLSQLSEQPGGQQGWGLASGGTQCCPIPAPRGRPVPPARLCAEAAELCQQHRAFLAGTALCGAIALGAGLLQLCGHTEQSVRHGPPHSHPPGAQAVSRPPPGATHLLAARPELPALPG